MEIFGDVSFQDAHTVEARLLQEAQDAIDEQFVSSASSDDDNSKDQEVTALEAVNTEIEILTTALNEDNDCDQEPHAGTSEGKSTRDLHMARLNERLVALKREKEHLKVQKAEPSGVPQSSETVTMLGNRQAELPGFVETEKDKLIRLGVLTPFASIDGFDKRVTHKDTPKTDDSEQSESSYDPDSEDISEEDDQPCVKELAQKYSTSLSNWRKSRPRTQLLDIAELPNRRNQIDNVRPSFWRSTGSRGQKRKRSAFRKTKRRRKGSSKEDKEDSGSRSESESGPNADDHSSDGGSPDSFSSKHDGVDDAEEETFRARIAELGPSLFDKQGVDFVEFDGGYRIPHYVYSKLFDYQKTGIKWLWELHTQGVGGIIGDEMGLGKTVQVCAFLGGLHASKKFQSALLIVPATVLHQWVLELHTWCPWLRAVVMHDSANKTMGSKKSREDLFETAANGNNGVLLTTYDRMRISQAEFLRFKWGYVILDEGHKIRNPDAEITLACKQVCTTHRIIMTGTPIQNRLAELWSLFDFVFPGRLGTLPVFNIQFAVPIQIGGYTNASRFQVATAYKCAVILRDLIAPYILQRRKADVGTQLPAKKEQILFCSLTDHQRDLYRAFLSSPEVTDIIEGNRHALAGIDILRKICNHPDLLEHAEANEPDEYGASERSAKLMVTMKILKHWKDEGSKALLFCQTQQMLSIVEDMVVKAGYTYRRMDGCTRIATRGRIIDEFNQKENVFLFLLTTKVGGIGVNLTGANKVLLYDPDWNPSTDIQARERAWRIGQSRDVTIYRLIVSGTIEEKIYQRQVFKQYISNKVLRDPKQKRFFASKDMKNLFTLGDEKLTTETSSIFHSVDGDMVVNATSKENDNKCNTGVCKGPVDGTAQVSAPDPASGASDKEGHVNGDTKILQDLFAEGIKGAIDHTKVESTNADEDIIMDFEASKIAREAAEELRASRQLCEGHSVSVPTWTGRSGVSGAPKGFLRFGSTQNPKFYINQGADEGPSSGVKFGSGGQAKGAAPSSSSLLKHMQNRSFEASGMEISNQLPESRRKLAEEWMAKVMIFLRSKNGEALSSDVILNFKGEVPAQGMSLFRSVLKQVATLHKREEVGFWVLKDEFS